MRRSVITVMLLSTLVLAFLSVAEGAAAEVRSAADSTAVAPSLPELQARVGAIFKNSCAVSGCHTGRRAAARLSLEPKLLPGSVRNVQSREVKTLKIVDTVDPAKSYLLMKLRGAKGIKGERMPRVGPALKEPAMKTIIMWVQGLAADSAAAGQSSKNSSRATVPGQGGATLESAGYSDGQADEAALSDELEEEYGEHGAFLGQTLINLPTTESLGRGELLFRVSHRFYVPTSEGHEYFFGLDGPAFVFVSLAYGITDRWGLALGRTNLRDEVALSAKVSVSQEDEGRVPFSVAVAAAACLTTEVPEGEDVFDSRNFRGSVQLCLSRAVCDRMSLLGVPSYSYNTDYSHPEDESTFGVGLGARFVLSENVSLVGEVIPVLSGYDLDSTTWGVGLEVKKGGHVFHLFVNDSYGLTPGQYLPGGDLDIGDGDVRLGFNIYRTL